MQLSSVCQLKSSQRYLLSNEEVCLKLRGEGLNSEEVGASATMNMLAVKVAVCTLSREARRHAARAEQTGSIMVK